MSLTSYRAAPPRAIRSAPPRPFAGGALDEEQERVGGVCLAWRRPTLPPLERQYHGRRGFSRPSSGWDRVFGPSLWPPGRASPAVMCEVREVSVEAAARLAWAGPALARTGGWALHADGGWAPVVAGAGGTSR